MPDHAFNSIEDFVFNQTFRDWVLHNESPHKAFWEEWMQSHPRQLAVMNHAKSIVYALSAAHSQLSEQEIEEEIRNILHKAKTERYPATVDESFLFAGKTTGINSSRKRIFLKWWAGVAAAALGVVALVYFTGNRKSITPGELTNAPIDKARSVAGTAQINFSDSAQLIILPDQSRVELAAGSSLTYTADGFATKREVHLKGEAFFNVTKIPSSPFLVYTHNMVTKVLGTSFRVKEIPGDKKASVWVKTGKVSVYKQNAFTTTDASSKQLEGVIVVPNQQVVYDLTTRQLTKNIIEKPVLLENSTGETFAFSSTPLKEVFARLEHAYGIQVMYDETMISSCSLSVNMGNETFYEKLDLICRAINASYESIDGSIFITSHGCK